MKKIVLLFMALLPLFAWAQANSADNIGRIVLKAYVPKYDNMPDAAGKLLETRLNQIITSQGIATEKFNTPFVLSAKINTLSKDIVPGPPQQIAMKLEVTLMMGNVEEGHLYQSLSINCMGVGQTEEKAYIAAFKNIRSANPSIQDFLAKSKGRVETYYQEHCRDILTEARKQAGVQNYGAALLALTSVPDVCRECYEQCATLAVQLYQKKTDDEGSTLLSRAAEAWAQSPNKDGANTAVGYLSQINAMAACQPRAQQLIADITKKLKSDDAREWNLKVEQYRNEVAQQRREWNQEVKERNREQNRLDRQQQYDQARYMTDAANTRAAIRAARDIGVAYAMNQPQEVTYFNCIYTW